MKRGEAKKLMKTVEDSMSNLNIDLQGTCECPNTIVEEYNKAVESLKK